jgi:hypothetical protein
MGTSQSKPSATGGSPLVPSWAVQDPPAPTGTQPSPDPNQEVLQPRRHVGFRRLLGSFYRSGNQEKARRALGHFARSVGGGAKGASQRYARAARVGGSMLAALARAGANQPPEAGYLDLRTLAGRPLNEAIEAIVNTFCPPGIFDEEASRVAMTEGLAEALGELDRFDPQAITDHTVVVATRCYVAELVFIAIMSEQGQSAAAVSPQQAIARENDVRDIVREVTDLHATPALQNLKGPMTGAQMEALVQRLVQQVQQDMQTW